MEQRELIKQIKSTRATSGLTQKDLANKTGIPRTTIAKIESGHRNTTINTMINLASAVGFDLRLVKKVAQNTLKRFERQFIPLNTIYLNEKNILHNYQFFQKLHSEKNIWPVLKSNAYGHGIKQITKVLKKKKIQYLIVDGYHEALQVWEVNPKQTVLLIGEMLPLNLQNLNLEKLALTVYNKETITELGRLGTHTNVHLKINTGMNRQGIQIDEIEEYLDLIRKYKNISLEGVFSHLANADGETDGYTKLQKEKFHKALTIIKSKYGEVKYVHLASTAGSLKLNDSETNSIRLGLGRYGFNPVHPGNIDYKRLLNLKPALRLESTLVNVFTLEKGKKVSYNCTFEASENMKVGVLPLGFHEVFDRKLSNKGFVKYKNIFCPIIGKICMNLTAIDLSNTDAKRWDTVEVISSNSEDKNSIESMAHLSETIQYETLVRLNENIRRIIN